jgi:hypothetical protein
VIVREHPETASFRYLAPPVAAALVAGGLITGAVGLAALAANASGALTWLTAGFVIPVSYLAGITAVAAVLARDVPPQIRARIPLVLAVMHLAWGTGFLTSRRGLHAKRQPDAHVGQPATSTENTAAAG